MLYRELFRADLSVLSRAHDSAGIAFSHDVDEPTIAGHVSPASLSIARPATLPKRANGNLAGKRTIAIIELFRRENAVGSKCGAGFATPRARFKSASNPRIPLSSCG